MTLTLTPEDLQLLDIDMPWRVVPGEFEIMLGKSSAEIALQGILTVKWRRALARQAALKGGAKFVNLFARHNTRVVSQ